MARTLQPRRPRFQHGRQKAVISGFLLVLIGVAGCGRIGQLGSKDAQEIVETSILVTRSLVFLARTVELAAAATQASSSPAAVIAVRDAIEKATDRERVGINYATCPCGNSCNCQRCGDGEAEARKQCTQNLSTVVPSFLPVCATPTVDEAGRGVTLDLGPWCQGCTVHGRRLGGRLLLEPTLQGDEAVVVLTLSPWRVDVPGRFDFSYFASTDPPVIETLEHTCINVPAGGVRGDQYDLEGQVRAVLDRDGKSMSLEYLPANDAINSPALIRQDRVNGIVHTAVQTTEDQPLQLVMKDRARGLAGGAVVNGTEEWITGDAAQPNWSLRMRQVEIAPNLPLPRSGRFVVQIRNRAEVELDFKEVDGVVHVDLTGASRHMKFEVAANK